MTSKVRKGLYIIKMTKYTQTKCNLLQRIYIYAGNTISTISDVTS